MPNIKIYDTSAKEVGELNLSDDIFNVPYNEALVHNVIVAYQANNRQGTQSALTRSEVRGHARKPWRQKGTGRSRHSSTKSPIWTGGGVAFAPKPRDYSKKVNKKAKAIAFLSAFSTKLANNEVIVLNDWNISEPKTKVVQSVLDNFKIAGRRVAVVVDDANPVVAKSAKNIQKLSVLDVELLNTYDVVSNEKLIMTEATIKHLEEAFK